MIRLAPILFLLGLCAPPATEAADPVRTPNIAPKAVQDLLTIENGTIEVGIDREMGASITSLSWKGYPKNMVNIHDPGRLIQQSYYAGKRLDRSADGQNKSWNPWAWNPIQGGGVGSWARVTTFERKSPRLLYAETVPKLWDMPDEEAEAVMRQWTGFDEERPDVLMVRCELVCQRKPGDRWGPALPRHQEVPALYFTRNFSEFQSYLGEGKWRPESQPPGPPWGKAVPPKNAIACFEEGGQGIAVFSPTATEHWNFGPHAGGNSPDPLAAPCVHLAPISKVNLGPRSTLIYRYWIVVGTRDTIAKRLDQLWEKYSEETFELKNP